MMVDLGCCWTAGEAADGVATDDCAVRTETRDGTMDALGGGFGDWWATDFLVMVFGFLVRVSNDGVRGSLDERVMRMAERLALRKAIGMR